LPDIESASTASRKRKAKNAKAEKVIDPEALPDETQPAPDMSAAAQVDEDEEWLRARNAQTMKGAPPVSDSVLAVTFEVRKPTEDEFFRVHPLQQTVAWLLERKFKVRDADEKPFYLVNENLVDRLVSEVKCKVRRYMMRRAVNRQGEEFLIAVPTDSNLGHAPDMRAYVETAETQWIKVLTERRGCKWEPGDDQKLAPAYSAISLARMIRLAFRDAEINSMNDEIVKKLRGAL